MASDPATDVAEHAELWVDGKALVPPPGLALFFKPVGVQCTVGDPEGRISLSEVAAPLLAWGLHPVGRLDADTEGLLPFARDGALTQRLLHPKRGVEKEYLAEVEGEPDERALQHLRDGVHTAAGVFRATAVTCNKNAVTLVVTEGKHRMVRRMLANVGHPVVHLRRIRFGQWLLADLQPGTYRIPDPVESAWLVP
jgi:23S rRNA pseudouridine2605 synthase